MIWRPGNIKNLDYFHKRLSTYYFILVGIPILALFVGMMYVYTDYNHLTWGGEQNKLMQKYKNWVAILSLSEAVSIFILMKWYWGKLKVIRVYKDFGERLERYYKLNVRYYLIMSVLALPLIPIYIHTQFLFFAGMYCIIIFMVMAMERPSTFRTMKNLRLNHEERQIVRDGGKVPTSENKQL